MVDFTYVGQSNPYAKILAKPSTDQFQFLTNGTVRMELGGNGLTCTDCTVTGTFSNVSDSRLKTERTDVTGPQALDVLSKT